MEILPVIALYLAFLICAGAIGAGAILAIVFLVNRYRGKAVR